MNSFSFFRLTQFFLIGLTLAVLPLTPVNFIPRTFPSPDFLFCFIVAWHLRDPQSSPLPLILFLTLLVDIVQFRPIGLWPIFMILLSNLIIINRRLFFNSPFVKELLFFSTIFFCSLMLELLFLTITFSPNNGFGVATQQVIITSFAYPVVVLILFFLLRLRYKTSRFFFSESL